MKRVIISDTHIGSKFYRAELLESFLKEAEYDQLILAGDIIDFIRVPEFTERAARIANVIDFSKEIIYLVGNHDRSLRGFIGQTLFGIKFMEKYEFEENGRKFKIEHGDAYDTDFIVAYNFIMSFISVAQSCIEHWFNINLSEWFTRRKLKKRKLIRIWDVLKRNNSVDVLVIGHLHCPEAIIWVDEEEKILTYVNSGDWVSHQTYVSIIDGEVRLKKYNKQ